MIQDLKKRFESGESQSLSWRISKLKKLKKELFSMEEELLSALYSDLNKSSFEALTSEVLMVKSEIDYALRHIKKWAKTKRVLPSFMQFPAKSHILREPHGVCLIMSPWNYPLQLSLSPLVGAIAGGNLAIIKPAKLSLHTGKALQKLVQNVFEPDEVRVVLGGREENTLLLSEPFDFVFFTGSTNVGKTVMRACAEKPCPLVLELGGKSPVLIDESCDIDIAAKSLIFGKALNLGQTCVAPDYVLVPKKLSKELVKKIKLYYEERKSSFSGRIISREHFSRLLDLVEDKSDFIYDESTLNMGLKLVINPSLDSKIMQEEIFGPILALIEYEDINEAVSLIKSKPKPLAFYLFSKNKEQIKRLSKYLSYGSCCINDCILQLTSPRLPFGGVGASGLGSYHGKYSFLAFTREKSVLHKGKFSVSRINSPSKIKKPPRFLF